MPAGPPMPAQSEDASRLESLASGVRALLSQIQASASIEDQAMDRNDRSGAITARQTGTASGLAALASGVVRACDILELAKAYDPRLDPISGLRLSFRHNRLPR